MSKYSISKKYNCVLCEAEYDNDLQAIDCYDAHYKVDKIIDVYYEKGKKCPYSIRVQLERSISNVKTIKKEATFLVDVDNYTYMSND